MYHTAIVILYCLVTTHEVKDTHDNIRCDTGYQSYPSNDMDMGQNWDSHVVVGCTCVALFLSLF